MPCSCTGSTCRGTVIANATTKEEVSQSRTFRLYGAIEHCPHLATVPPEDAVVEVLACVDVIVFIVVAGFMQWRVLSYCNQEKPIIKGVN
jgi:hypothetical protein